MTCSWTRSSNQAAIAAQEERFVESGLGAEDLLDGAIDDGVDEVFLVGEVVVELALADVRGGADVVEGGACDAVLEDELSGRVEHAISRGAALVGTVEVRGRSYLEDSSNLDR